MRVLEVLVVYKKSQLRLARENKNKRMQRLVKKNDASVDALAAADAAHTETLRAVQRALAERDLPHRTVYRARLTAEMTEGRLVVTVGGDGTLLDASHKVTDAAVLGVNSDPRTSVGFLCAAHRDNFADILDALLLGELVPTPVRRLAGTLDGEPLPFPVLNDILVAHKNPAATSRYLIRARNAVEDHKSSGVWIATAAGSTAAMASAGGAVLDIDDDTCQLRVRESFVADGPRIALANMLLARNQRVTLTSKMREGRIYLDGPHEMLRFPFGAQLVLHGSAPPLRLVATEHMADRRRVAQTRSRAAAGHHTNRKSRP